MNNAKGTNLYIHAASLTILNNVILNYLDTRAGKRLRLLAAIIHFVF
jgi:Fe-S cluster assembly iron-binding protein IscA